MISLAQTNTDAKSGFPLSRAKHSVQPKLKINQPGDRYEQEADAMAERVMRLSASETAGKPITGMIGQSVQRKFEEDDKKNPILRKAESSGGLEASSSFVTSLNDSKGGGAPLPKETRRFMENAFSSDFSSVRFHNDWQAAKLNQEIHGKAFTYKDHIYFSKGTFSPESNEGMRLISHELTHVVQQKNGINNLLQRQVMTTPMQIRFDDNYDQGINDVVSQYSPIGTLVNNGCLEWKRLALLSPSSPPSVIRELLISSCLVGISAITAGVGGAILSGVATGLAGLALRASVDAGKQIINSSISHVVDRVLGNPEQSSDAVLAHFNTISGVYADVINEQQSSLRGELSRLSRDENKWLVLQETRDILRNYHRSSGLFNIARNGCIDSWLAREAYGRFRSDRIGIDEESMARQLSRKNLSGERGILVLRLNDMHGPSNEPYPFSYQLNGIEGIDDDISRIIRRRRISDLYIPKIVERSGRLDGSYFRVVFDEENNLFASSSSGTYSIWEGGRYLPNDDARFDSMESLSHDSTTTLAIDRNAGRTFLALRGMYESNEGGRPLPTNDSEFNTRVLWGLVSISSMLNRYTASGRRI